MEMANFDPLGLRNPECISVKRGIRRGYDQTHKYMWRCDNVGGLDEHVTCHMFWFVIRPGFVLLYTWCRTLPVDQLWQSVRHITCFRAKRCLFGVALTRFSM